MINIEHKRDTDLSADDVWSEMRHYDRLLKWIPRGDESTMTVAGQGVGAVRDLELATMGHVQHIMLAFDDETKMFSYELTEGKPLGMQDYRVIATVTPIDDGNCTIRWVGKMTGDGSVDEAKIGNALESALANMTTGIIAVVKGQTPDFTLQPLVDE